MTPEERAALIKEEARRDALKQASRGKKKPKHAAKAPGFAIIPRPPKPDYTEPNRWSKSSNA